MKKSKKKRKATGDAAYRIIGLILIILIFTIIGKALVTMYADGDRWREIAKMYNKQSIDSIAPIRGNIYGANGELLAIESNVQKLTIDFQAESLKSIPKKKLNEIFYHLSELLERELSTPENPISASKLRSNWEKARHSKRNRGVLLVKGYIPYSKWMRIAKDTLFTSRDSKDYIAFRKALPSGIESRRTYPYGSLGKRLIGSIYTPDQAGTDMPIGKQGIELVCDSLLRGEKGVVNIYRFGSRAIRFTTKEPIHGADVYTTLDMDKQYLLESELRKTTEQADPDFSIGIMMEVNTGKIVAISNLQRGENGKFYESQNLAVSSLTEPGSTFKTVSLLAALNHSNISPYDSVDVGNGTMKVANHVLKDWNVARGLAGFGKIDFATAMYRSSNVGIAKLVYRAFYTPGKKYLEAGKEYVDAVHETGICDPLNLKLEGAAKHAIVRYPNDKRPWSGTTLAWMAHGYETQIPPIATLAFYNAIANNGKFMRPYFLNEVRRGDKVIEEYHPEVIREQIGKNPEVIKSIQDILRGVVVNVKGTAKAVNSEIVEICGKTGTALYWDNGAKKMQSTFVGFFPYRKPRYSMLVMIRGARHPEYAGAGGGCGGVIRRVAEAVVSIDGRRPVDSLHLNVSEGVPFIQAGRKIDVLNAAKLCNSSLTFDKDSKRAEFIRVSKSNSPSAKADMVSYRKGYVPDLIGFASADALYLLGKCGLRCITTGYGTVVDQSIPPGTAVALNTLVRLSLKPQFEKPKYAASVPVSSPGTDN